MQLKQKNIQELYHSNGIGFIANIHTMPGSYSLTEEPGYFLARFRRCLMIFEVSTYDNVL
ncbi:hypothetical protein BOV90_04305 [Solemya velum gill symbiont]|nr:hypothetical protein BOV89_07700 [Solemya velum gill symbiont]OOY40396.1 hypothetical protein BOV90_04305 [Solemya velum gill symbiont]OOY44794.1 hypothetical protein BOV91_00315 [Solemya velum gill symbiont]OOY46144.1 hypothetical protein BOV92_03635 [Solemya velum gill symbiont]OOY47183.1 hypothetical protein BOV93_07695 [Solemya velum gill symbiont]